MWGRGRVRDSFRRLGKMLRGWLRIMKVFWGEGWRVGRGRGVRVMRMMRIKVCWGYFG